SSRTRSHGSRLSVSSATRPFSAASTRWPINSRLRASSSRLTLLSSTISSRDPLWPCPPSRMPHLRQRLRRARVFLLERVEDFIGAAAQQREAAELELARTRRKRRGAERIAVRLQRVRGAPERLGVPGVGGMPKLGKHLRRLVEKRLYEV